MERKPTKFEILNARIQLLMPFVIALVLLIFTIFNLIPDYNIVVINIIRLFVGFLAIVILIFLTKNAFDFLNEIKKFER